MKGRVLIFAGAAVVAYFVFLRKASAATSTAKPGFGQPGFVAQPTPDLPVKVTGCSFARAGTQLIDVNTGKVISEVEGQRRAKSEGCPLPPPEPINIFVALKPGGPGTASF